MLMPSRALEKVRAQAQVLAQLAASALSAMNFSASVSSGRSQSVGCSTSFNWSGEVPDYEQLLFFWNEGVCLIAEQRPDLFTQGMVVQLKPGSIQELDCCRTIGKVFGQPIESIFSE